MGNCCPKDGVHSGSSSLAQIPHTIIDEVDMTKMKQTQIMNSSQTLQQSSNALTINRTKGQVAIEDFIKIDKLGHGASGVLFKVRHRGTNKIYAMKQIDKKKIFKNELQTNTVLERNFLKQSKHPFIVKLKYSLQTPKKLYLVMEYINGGDFFKILLKTKGLPESVVAFIIVEVVLALEYLNNQLKVIYRDLKPENILLTTTGHVKLTDFGLATLRKDEDLKNYTLAGTPEYLAPEIINKLGYSFEVDLWTLGVLIYEMINGIPPFTVPDRNTQKILQLILQNKPIYPQIMSDEAVDLVSRLLKTNPKERIGANGYDEIKNHPFFSKIKWSEFESPQPNIPGGDDTYNSKKLN